MTANISSPLVRRAIDTASLNRNPNVPKIAGSFWAFVGVVAGAAVIVLIAIIIVCCVCCRRRKSRKRTFGAKGDDLTATHPTPHGFHAVSSNNDDDDDQEMRGVRPNFNAQPSRYAPPLHASTQARPHETYAPTTFSGTSYDAQSRLTNTPGAPSPAPLHSDLALSNTGYIPPSSTTQSWAAYQQQHTRPIEDATLGGYVDSSRPQPQAISPRSSVQYAPGPTAAAGVAHYGGSVYPQQSYAPTPVASPPPHLAQQQQQQQLNYAQPAPSMTASTWEAHQQAVHLAQASSYSHYVQPSQDGSFIDPRAQQLGAGGATRLHSPPPLSSHEAAHAAALAALSPTSGSVQHGQASSSVEPWSGATASTQPQAVAHESQPSASGPRALPVAPGPVEAPDLPLKRPEGPGADAEAQASNTTGGEEDLVPPPAYAWDEAQGSSTAAAAQAQAVGDRKAPEGPQ